jgi:hypothetical protein
MAFYLFCRRAVPIARSLAGFACAKTPHTHAKQVLTWRALLSEREEVFTELDMTKFFRLHRCYFLSQLLK